MTHDLHWYAETGQTDALRDALAAGLDPNTRNEEGQTAAHLAAARGQSVTLAALLDAGADHQATEAAVPGYTPLHRACLAAAGTEAATAVVRLLLERGADANRANARGETALHLLAPWCDSDLIDFVLHRGAEVRVTDQSGRSPLHVACRRGAATPTEALLFGDSASSPVKRKESARTRLEDEHVVEILLAEGAAPDAADGQGLTALHVASNRGTAWAARIVLDHGANVAARDAYEVTPLHRAATSAIAELLLEHDAPIDAPDRDGNTPLHRAIGAGRIEVADLLLERGAGVLLTNGDGRTPLHFAASAGRAQTAEKLLFEGADVNARDHDGRTPLYAAEAAGHGHVADTLKRRGGKRRPRRFLFFDLK